LELINQLLDLSRLESKSMKLRTSKNDFVQFIKTISASFESIAKTKNLTFQINTPVDSFDLYFDLDKMEKIVYNLISNAFKFTDSNGAVILNISLISNDRNHSGLVQFIVEDTGKGIESSELEKIFDRFYQIDDSVSREYEGSGIGLSLVKELVELHKGSIKVESEFGLGSRFIVELPIGISHLLPDEIIDELIVKEDPLIISQESIQNHTLKPDQNGSKNLRKVLIVEDNADMRFFISDQLSKMYHVFEAINGEEGLTLANKISPELIITDLMMPKMDGITFCEKVKSNILTLHIPIIMLTAKAGTENKIRGFESGVDDYLTKPFSVEELLSRVKNLIKQRDILRRHFLKEISQLSSKEKISSQDEIFIESAVQLVEKHLSNFDFDAETFVNEIGISRSQLHRKLKATTGQSLTGFIRLIRLKHAEQLLNKKAGNVADIAYQVGFNSPAYFSKCFYEQFKKHPSQFKFEETVSE